MTTATALKLQPFVAGALRYKLEPTTWTVRDNYRFCWLVSHFYRIRRGVTNTIKMQMQHFRQGKLPIMKRSYCVGGSWIGNFSLLVYLYCLVFDGILQIRSPSHQNSRGERIVKTIVV